MSFVEWIEPGSKKKARADEWSGKIVETPEGAKVEVRKTFRFSPRVDVPKHNNNFYSQVLIVVHSNTVLYPRVALSMNSKTAMDITDVMDLQDVVAEAEEKLKERLAIIAENNHKERQGLVRSPSGDWYMIPDGPKAKAEKELYTLACEQNNEAGMLYFEEGHTGWIYVNDD